MNEIERKFERNAMQIEPLWGKCLR